MQRTFHWSAAETPVACHRDRLRVGQRLPLPLKTRICFCKLIHQALINSSSGFVQSSDCSKAGRCSDEVCLVEDATATTKKSLALLKSAVRIENLCLSKNQVQVTSQTLLTRFCRRLHFVFRLRREASRFRWHLPGLAGQHEVVPPAIVHKKKTTCAIF